MNRGNALSIRHGGRQRETRLPFRCTEAPKTPGVDRETGFPIADLGRNGTSAEKRARNRREDLKRRLEEKKPLEISAKSRPLLKI